jgi:regulatory protein
MVARNSRRPISPPRSEPIDAALRYLAARPRSEVEVRRRLARAGYAAAAIDAVIEQLRAHGYVDDAAFASYWVEQRQTFRPRGARLLRAELWQRGVRTDLPDTDAERDAYRAAEKRAHQLAATGTDQRTFTTKLSQFLARRGFDWDVISPTVERLWGEVSTSSGSARAPTV